MAADPTTVSYRYVASKNTITVVSDTDEKLASVSVVAYIPGVPLRDLTREDVQGFPEWVRDAIAASDLYAAVEAPKPPKAPKE